MKTSKSIIILLLMVCLVSPKSYSQPEVPKKLIDAPEIMTVSCSPAGINSLKSDGSSFSIPFRKFTLPEFMDIEDVSYDSILNELFFLSSKKGRPSVFKQIYLFGYKIEKSKTEWGKQFVYEKGIALLPTPEMCVLRVKGLHDWENFSFNKKTGILAWRNDDELRNVIPALDIAFNEALDCINLSNGEVKWSRKIKNDYGSLGEFIVNGKLFTVIDGVHCMDLNDGSGWDFFSSMGKKETGELASDIMGSAFAGTLYGVTGVNYIQEQSTSTSTKQKKTIGYPKTHSINYSGAYTRTGLASNLLFQEDKIFFSAMNRLFCIENKTGKKTWECRLPDERTGVAFIISRGDQLIFFNRGWCYRDKTIRSYFSPYFSIIDKKSGSTICSRSLNIFADPIVDFLITDSLIHIITPKDIRSYNVNCILTRKFSSSPDSLFKNISGKFQSLIKDDQLMDYYLPSASGNTNYMNLLSLRNEGAFCFLNCENGIACFDSHMHQIRWIPEKDLLVRRARIGDVSLLSSQKEFITNQVIINDRKAGQLLLQFNPLCKSDIDNGCLILFPQGNSISVITLSDLAAIALNHH